MKRGFTMVELLIVITIIVVVIGLAVPAFNVIRGSKSEEAATNQMAALLNRARTDAISGKARYAGIMVFREGETTKIALVRSVEGVATPRVALDWDGGELATLPSGIAIQGLTDCVVTSAGRSDDGYLGYNTRNTVAGAAPILIAYGPVILFDQRGALVSDYVELCATVRGVSNTRVSTAMARLLYGLSVGTTLPQNTAYKNVVPHPEFKTCVAVVTMNRESFANAGSTDTDAEIAGTAYASDEKAEEDWIDREATPLLVNRYSGAFVISR